MLSDINHLNLSSRINDFSELHISPEVNQIRSRENGMSVSKTRLLA